MKTITVLTQGNASSSKTWSNIPYYLVETLKQKGYKVNAVDVEVSGWGRFFYDKLFCRLLRHSFLPDTTYSFDRTMSFQRAANKRIEEAVIKFPETDLFISTSFSFLPSKYTDKPCALLCDWTYEYLISHFKGRSPDFFEKKGIAVQDSVIKKADYIFSLFPDVAEHMKRYYPKANISYLGNVINALPFDLDLPSLEQRLSSPRVAFVGLSKYKAGLESLMASINLLNSQGISVSLDVIGMASSDFSFEIPPYIRFHGYLEKSDKEQFKKYNSILKGALAFINTTPQWAGFSSSLEAMYYGLPIFTSKYRSFVETFGESIEFGDYSLNNKPDEISSFIQKLLSINKEEYVQLCSRARKMAEPFTWSAYVDKIISKIDLA